MVELENTEESGEFALKVEVLKSVLDSSLESSKKLEELEEVKQKLEEQLEKIEDLLLKEIEFIVDQEISQKNRRKPIWRITALQKLKEKAETDKEWKGNIIIIELLNDRIRNIEKRVIKEILVKVNDFLGAKRIFFNIRQITIKRLQSCCNELETSINIGEYAKAIEAGNIANAIGTAVSFVPLKLAGNPVKALGEITVAVSNSLKRKFSAESIEAFREYLVNDKTTTVLSCFDEVYNSLIDVIQENKELGISSAIVKVLNLENRLDGKKTKLFNVDYGVYEVATNTWDGEKTYLSPEEMKKTIDLLRENFKQLKSELDQEEKQLIKEFQGKFEKENNSFIQQQSSQNCVIQSNSSIPNQMHNFNFGNGKD
ncbi:hypothetical protein [endosymbiont GvMRE of Glomus versiforme]|uniref:hypothetical protein n=1 Tax=endosymbiont GvMRE of Glomus versiforme TaxID=2039283 RepID=UPI0011C3C39D|nr:hypothetical protein [endosymbiont GvMRE of Glomus versiforme]